MSDPNTTYKHVLCRAVPAILSARIAIIARAERGEPWTQIESIIGMDEAVKYAENMERDEDGRIAAVADMQDDVWADDRAAMPYHGTVWQHTNGTLYCVAALTNLPDEDRYPCTVVYKGQNGRIWSRRFDDWYRSMHWRPALAGKWLPLMPEFCDNNGDRL